MYNRFMRVMVFFDLPVTTSNLRKEASMFRKYLIYEGFDMLQFSVYSRTTRNHDDSMKYVIRIQRNTPDCGSVRVLVVTEKQYASMFIFSGEPTQTESFLATNEMLDL